jgi:hypothetical protein
MLAKINRTANQIQSALMLGCMDGASYADYMDAFQTHGWLNVLGSRLTVVSPHPSLFRWSAPASTVPYGDSSLQQILHEVPYSKGFFYARRLIDHRDELQSNVDSYVSVGGQLHLHSKIAEKAFDLIIYSCSHRSTAYSDLVFENYSPDQVIVVDGNDDAPSTSGVRRELASKSTFFMREIREDCNQI